MLTWGAGSAPSQTQPCGALAHVSISQQLAQLLSASPGNLVYHLATLFALQAALGLAWWQVRRERSDDQARRVAWAAAALLLARLTLLLAALATAVLAATPEQQKLLDAAILPPLEQALNTVTALFLGWALAPRWRGAPRLLDAALGIGLLLATVIYLFFAGNWYSLVWQGQAAVPYNASSQTLVWGVLQITALLAGMVAIWRARPEEHWLRLLILGTLALAHFAHLWNYPEPFPAASEIPYWIRLGHLMAFPLLAVFAYRANLRRLLLAQMSNRPQNEQLAAALRQATPPLTGATREEVLMEALVMAARCLPAHFTAIAVPSSDSRSHLRLVSVNRAQAAQNWAQAAQNWELKLDDWPALRLALAQQQPAELSPDGLGARQLFALYQELGVVGGGSLRVLPLAAGGTAQGLLLFAAPADQPAWTAADVDLAAAVAGYLGALLALARRRETEVERAESPDERLSPRYLEDGETAAKLQAAQSRLAELEQQAVAQRETAERVSSLETEAATLRAALAEAEAAAALAAAHTELSPEWVMQTITRYAAELEEAHSRLRQLQAALAQQDQPRGDQAVVALAQELRSPIMVIAGYTELLLSETIGALNEPQRDFLRRLKGNSERMGLLLQQIIHAADPNAPRPAVTTPAMPAAAITAAADAVMGQIRQKHLRLSLDITPDLPLLSLEQEQLYQIVVYLLENACRASASGGSVRLRAQHVQQTTGMGLLGVFQLAVRDSGKGILPQDRPHVFEPHLSADEPLIAGLGETGIGLATVRRLVAAQGGRVWVESETAQGSTFTVLLPILTPRLQQGQNGDGPQ